MQPLQTDAQDSAPNKVLNRVRVWLCGRRDCTRLLCPLDSPGQKTGVHCRSLLWGIFPTQGLNLGLLPCRQILYHLSDQGSPNKVVERLLCSVHPLSTRVFCILCDTWRALAAHPRGMFDSQEESSYSCFSCKINWLLLLWNFTFAWKKEWQTVVTGKSVFHRCFLKNKKLSLISRKTSDSRCCLLKVKSEPSRENQKTCVCHHQLGNFPIFKALFKISSEHHAICIMKWANIWKSLKFGEQIFSRWPMTDATKSFTSKWSIQSVRPTNRFECNVIKDGW